MAEKYNQRYQIFLDAFGKQKNYMYVLFIHEMKKLYLGSIYLKIRDQNDFTLFIKNNAFKFSLQDYK